MQNTWKTRYSTLSSRVCLALELLFIASLIPLIIMGFYNHPVGDDFTYGMKAHLAWQSTHSLLAVLQAAIETSKSFWTDYQGPFTSAFFMALQPAVISERLYPLTTFIMLGSLIFSTFILFRVLLHGYLGFSSVHCRIVTLVYLLVSIQVLPTPSEAFYWYCGAIHYIFMHSCMLLLFACCLQFLLEQSGKRFLFLFLACALGFITGGANFVTGLFTLVLFGVLTVFCLYYRKKSAGFLLIPFLFYLGSFILCVTAPGNAVRESDVAYTPNALSAIYDSFQYCLKYMGEWNNIYLVIALLFLLPVLWIAVSRTRIPFPLPGLIPLASFCILSSMYAPCTYALGTSVIYGRTLNIIMLTYYMLLILNLTYLLGWLRSKLQEQGSSLYDSLCSFLSSMKTRYHRIFLSGIAISAILCVFFTYHQNLTTKSAVHDLKKGYAQSYHQEVLHRIALLTTPDADEIWVPNYSVRPYLLDLEDLNTDPQHWRNQATADWYGKKIVHLSIVY